MKVYVARMVHWAEEASRPNQAIVLSAQSDPQTCVNTTSAPSLSSVAKTRENAVYGRSVFLIDSTRRAPVGSDSARSVTGRRASGVDEAF